MLSRLRAGVAGGPAGDAPGAATALPAVKKSHQQRVLGGLVLLKP